MRANRLAHRLVKSGAGLEVPVALSIERSPEMIVALLGILNACGAYGPLDANYPAETGKSRIVRPSSSMPGSKSSRT